MNQDLQIAKEHLTQGSYTCVLAKEQQIFTSFDRGVKPLLGWLEAGIISPGFSAADKVVGKATAYLYCLLGAKAVHANVMSEAAVAVLEQAGIAFSYDKKVDYIRNRQNTGMCPMEEATQSSVTAEEALLAIKAKLKALNS